MCPRAMCQCCGEIQPQRHGRATSLRLFWVRCAPATRSPRRGRGRFWKGACGVPTCGHLSRLRGTGGPGARAGASRHRPLPRRVRSPARVCARRGEQGADTVEISTPCSSHSGRRHRGGGKEEGGRRPGAAAGERRLPPRRSARPAQSPLPGAGRPPFGPPGAGAAGQPPGGRLLARPWRRRRCLRRAGGGAAERAQLPAPFKPRRPPARSVCVQPGSRAGGSRRQHSRGRAFLLFSSVAPCPAPPPPSSCPVSRQSPLLPPQPSSAMPRYELALILKAMQRVSEGGAAGGRGPARWDRQSGGSSLPLLALFSPFPGASSARPALPRFSRRSCAACSGLPRARLPALISLSPFLNPPPPGAVAARLSPQVSSCRLSAAWASPSRGPPPPPGLSPHLPRAPPSRRAPTASPLSARTRASPLRPSGGGRGGGREGEI